MAGITGNQAWLAAIGGVPLKKPLVDRETVGDFYCRVSCFISAGYAGGFPVAIELPRRPSFFFYLSDTGCVVYSNASDLGKSDGTTLYVRARQGSSDLVSANVTLLVG